jgi:hypothetical protein
MAERRKVDVDQFEQSSFAVAVVVWPHFDGRLRGKFDVPGPADLLPRVLPRRLDKFG